MSDDIFVVGVGMTPFGKFLDVSLKELARDAVTAALADAGCEVADIDVAYFSNASQAAVEGQYMIPGQLALRSMGFARIPIVNVENACASASTAFYLASMQLKAGEADVALAVGAEKMYAADKERSFAVLGGAWDVHEVEQTLRNLELLRGGVLPPQAEGPTKSVFMEVYAALAAQHMRRFGSTPRQFAAVAAKNHHHSVHNPLAQYRTDYSIDEILAARPVAWPLTLPMCAPISDGAAAVLLCRSSALHKFSRPRAVKVYSTVLASGSARGPEDLHEHISRRAALLAYERAGIGPEDISVAEVHDATAVGEVIQSENLGFCDLGEGGLIAERGETAIGGRIPINPSGGLECKGHPIGVTGLAQVVELVTQLRRESGQRQVDAARFAIAENGGGFHGFEEAVACVTILGPK